MAKKAAVSREFEARLSHAATGKYVNPAENGYLFRIREGYGSKRRGIGSAFHQLCPRYSGTLIPIVPTAIRLWETYTFFTCLSLSLKDISSLKYCLKEPLNHNQPTSHCRMHT